jgi:hypothetical protein
MAPNATPIMMPTARSTTLPRIIKALKSFNTLHLLAAYYLNICIADIPCQDSFINTPPK